MPKKLKRALNPQQENFARAYFLNGGNVTKAAIDAGYTERSAHSTGHLLTKHPEVIALLEKLRAEADKKTVNKFTVSKERIMQELAKIALADITNYATVEQSESGTKDQENGVMTYEHVQFKPSREWKPGAGRAVKKLAMTKHGIAMEFHDKKGALETLAKMQGYITDKTQLSNDPDNPIEHVQVIIGLPDNGRGKKE